MNDNQKEQLKADFRPARGQKGTSIDSNEDIAIS